MRKTGLALMLCGCGLTLTAQAQDYVIDSSHTFAYFEVAHRGLSTFRGRFDKTEGTASLDLEKKTGSVDITIDAASVSTGVPRLDAHLRNPDFFDVEKYPTLTFKSSEFKFEGDKLVEVVGELTMHGVTRPLTLKVLALNCNNNACGLDAVASLKRSEFGMTYGLGGGVGDEVTIRIGAEARVPRNNR